MSAPKGWRIELVCDTDEGRWVGRLVDPQGVEWDYTLGTRRFVATAMWLTLRGIMRGKVESPRGVKYVAPPESDATT